MIRILLFAVIILAILAVQILFSKSKINWLKWIVPVILFILTTTFYVFNLTDAFAGLVEYGRFLVYHKGPGLLALILKTGVVYFPFLLSLIIFIVFQKKHKHKLLKGDKEIEKMMIKDL